MLYGYCRVSRKTQSIDRQIRNIKSAYPEAVIIQEIHTRTNLDRKEWQKLMRIIKTGDTIVFDSVSRMSGNADDGFAAYQDLYDRGINLIFLKEPHIDTATYKKALSNSVELTGSNVDCILEGVNKYLMLLAAEQIRLAFEQSEKEVEDLHQRTHEGIETARLNGKQIGQVPGAKLTTKKSIKAKEIILKHSKSFNGTLSDAEVMKLAELSRNTYYKYKRELQEESREVLRPDVKYWEGRTPPPEYYGTPDPELYKRQPVFNYTAMAKYARDNGREITDLTYDEVLQFIVET